MGLFDNSLTRASAEDKFIPKDIRDAYASALYCCANADKDISDDELMSLDYLFMNISVFDDFDEADYLMLAEKNSQQFSPLQILQGSFNYISEKLRAQLFCYCCDMVLADGAIKEEEKQTLERIADISGIGEEIAGKIIEVAFIRECKR